MKRRIWEILYLMRKTPWDTGVTPPELVDLVEGGLIKPGCALDIGCGTGTNSIYLSRHGFQTTGIDISRLAVIQARFKSWKDGIPVKFFAGDVLRLAGSKGSSKDIPFDFILDIGCLHSITSTQLRPYADMVDRILRVGGLYLLYAWGTRPWHGGSMGLMPPDIKAALGSGFNSIWTKQGEEAGASSFWYLFQRVG